MQKALFFPLILVIFLSFTKSTKNCSNLVFFKEGGSTIHNVYGKEGVFKEKIKTTYSKITNSNNVVIATALQETYNKTGQAEDKTNYTVKCNNGVLLFDINSMIPMSDKEKKSSNGEINVENSYKEIPCNLMVGDTLKNVEFKVSVKPKESFMPALNIQVKIYDRKVEAIEHIKTAAGVFECYKLSEKSDFKSIATVKTKALYWFSLTAGTVKSETYDIETGKLIKKSELTSIKDK